MNESNTPASGAVPYNALVRLRAQSAHGVNKEHGAQSILRKPSEVYPGWMSQLELLPKQKPEKIENVPERPSTMERVFA
jgi:hypothetical protein